MERTTSQKLIATGYTKYCHPIDAIKYVATLHKEAEDIYNSDNVQMNPRAAPNTRR